MRNPNRTKLPPVLLASGLGAALGLGVAAGLATATLFWSVFGVALVTTLWLEGVRRESPRLQPLLTSEREARRSVA